MRLNIKFKEGKHHAWLETADGVELFIHRPAESLVTVNGQLSCKVPSEMMEDIRQDKESKLLASGTGGMFICCAAANETKLYQVSMVVAYAGGDVLMFLKLVATFH